MRQAAARSCGQVDDALLVDPDLSRVFGGHDGRPPVGGPWRWAKERSDALRHYISLIENIGIFVSKTTGEKIPLSDMRGAFFQDEFAPFIVLNSRDALSAQIPA